MSMSPKFKDCLLQKIRSTNSNGELLDMLLHLNPDQNELKEFALAVVPKASPDNIRTAAIHTVGWDVLFPMVILHWIGTFWHSGMFRVVSSHFNSMWKLNDKLLDRARKTIVSTRSMRVAQMVENCFSPIVHAVVIGSNTDHVPSWLCEQYPNCQMANDLKEALSFEYDSVGVISFFLLPGNHQFSGWFAFNDGQFYQLYGVGDDQVSVLSDSPEIQYGEASVHMYNIELTISSELYFPLYSQWTTCGMEYAIRIDPNCSLYLSKCVISTDLRGVLLEEGSSLFCTETSFQLQGKTAISIRDESVTVELVDCKFVNCEQCIESEASLKVIGCRFERNTKCVVWSHWFHNERLLQESEFTHNMFLNQESEYDWLDTTRSQEIPFNLFLQSESR